MTTFRSLPVVAREIRADDAVLEAVYEAARRGLKGDQLAFAANLLPTEYRRLLTLDPLVEVAERKGKADAEMALSGVLMDTALSGDAKSALAVLQHRHDWTARQEVSMEVSHRISITAALEAATARVEQKPVIEIGSV